MSDTATAPTSLADMIAAAQPAPAAAAPTAASPATTQSAAPPASDASAAQVTTDDSAVTAATTATIDGTDSTTTTDTAAADSAVAAAATAGTATTDGTAAQAAIAAIDWGSAMPALKAKAQELGLQAGVVDKFDDIENLLRSIDERERQVGQQSAYVGAFNQLAQAGVTIPMLHALMKKDAAALQSLLGQPAAAAPGPNGNGQAAPAWKGDYLAGRDAEGKPIFNRAALSRDGVSEAQAAQLHAGWNEQLADIFRGPETFEQYLARLIESRVGQAVQQTEQKLTVAQQQALYQTQQATQMEAAQKAETDAAVAWGQQNAKLLYVNGQDIASGATKFFQDMQAYINSGAVNPNLPHAKQLEVAKNYVLAVNRPANAAAPTPSDRAKRQPAQSSSAVKLTPSQFHEKYHERYADQGRESLGLAEWLIYEATGKIPELARK